MKAVFICQALDADDPYRAVAHRWLNVFAEHPKVSHIHALCLRKGRCVVPENVRITQIGSGNRVFTLLAFYRTVFTLLLKKEVDFFFVHMGGAYPILLFPLNLLFRKPVYQWKAHPSIGFIMRLNLWADKRIFTVNRASFPVSSGKVHEMGHGIDVEKLPLQLKSRPVDKLITIGRISPVKKIDSMIRLIAEYKKQYGKQLFLTVVGSALRKEHEQYPDELRKLARELDVAEQVSFPGVVERSCLGKLLTEASIFLSFSGTAVDKASLEAMTVGTPVLTANVCLNDLIPDKYKRYLVLDMPDAENRARVLYSFLNLKEEEKEEISKALSKEVTLNHSDRSLFNHILEIIGKDLS